MRVEMFFFNASATYVEITYSIYLHTDSKKGLLVLRSGRRKIDTRVLLYAAVHS